jgi:hypothetical protein
MTGVYSETLENAQITARLVEHEVYLKGKNQGWTLSDEVPRKPFYVIYPDGRVNEVLD